MHSTGSVRHEHHFLGGSHVRNERRLRLVVGLTLVMMIGETEGCVTGESNCGSTRPRRASNSASLRSFLRSLRVINGTRRGLATITSKPARCARRLTQGDCPLTSMTRRADMKRLKNAVNSF